MSKEMIFARVSENRPLVSDFYLLTLDYVGPAPEPGQFVNLTVEPFLLKRPFAVFDYTPGTLSLLYKKVGEGTKKITLWEPGLEVSLLCPLGKGFPEGSKAKKRVLVGGGTGIASLYYYAARYPENTRVLIGVNTAAEGKAMKELFAPLKAEVKIAVAQESSEGFYHGFVTDFLASETQGEADYDLYACGPHGMFLSIEVLLQQKKISPQKTLLSLEARMGCGFGVCLGCAVEKKVGDGFFYVCKDGPVFDLNELNLHG